MKTLAIAITNGPLVLRDGATLVNTRVIAETPAFGRIIFAEPTSPLVLVVGSGVTITGCHFDGSY